MTDARQPKGWYFEELEVGSVIQGPGRTITETDIVSFAGLSGDYNPLHTDAEFAKTALFGERIAHGLLVLAVASGLAWRSGFSEGTVDAFIGLDWKFRAPVRIGDTVRIEFEVKKKKAMPRLGGGFVTFSITILNQKDETVQKGDWTLLIRSRPKEEQGD